MKQPSVSVCVPTFTRRKLWQSGWLLSRLREQTDTDFELIIVDDHSEDDTVELLLELFKAQPPPCPTKILRVLAPRAKPYPAWAISMNCAYHCAAGDIIIHLDDDMQPHRDMVAHVKTLPLAQPAVVWAMLSFYDDDGIRFPGSAGDDPRLARCFSGRDTHDWSLAPLPVEMQVHWGGAYAVRRETILDIGGCDLNFAGFHNVDTRLGYRLTHNGVKSLLCFDPRFSVNHFGRTWAQILRPTERAKLARSQGPTRNLKVIANGGRAFWSSKWFDFSYSVHVEINP